MKIKAPAKAGTMESNDIYIMIQPNDEDGIIIELESIVMKQFGKQIKQVILETLESMEIKNIHVVAKDRGALDYTIRARVETAVKRAM
ncbi:citrate lyase subunit gamma (acyl carrier protein) [Anaerovirgula multivorans]|uniref:Citrate lyase subunit gamma (Acyl carrier protein) n=1 Tax=Anaerovirgula multivorans TaxID=312168 RepID=A0A239DBA4_9FIRM|nr:citrate lyase acyl carrier protein [Anaerovirgula multivorans]SNS28973.1 citrate lyase subunit gamma (acyl carrier protein) [Anaerovirgula multivorans]